MKKINKYYYEGGLNKGELETCPIKNKNVSKGTCIGSYYCAKDCSNYIDGNEHEHYVICPKLIPFLREKKLKRLLK